MFRDIEFINSDLRVQNTINVNPVFGDIRALSPSILNFAQSAVPIRCVGRSFHPSFGAVTLFRDERSLFPHALH